MSPKIWVQEPVPMQCVKFISREQHLCAEKGRVPCMDSCLGFLQGLLSCAEVRHLP